MANKNLSLLLDAGNGGPDGIATTPRDTLTMRTTIETSSTNSSRVETLVKQVSDSVTVDIAGRFILVVKMTLYYICCIYIYIYIYIFINQS